MLIKMKVLIMITIVLGVIGVRAGGPDDNQGVIRYTDTCDYTGGYVSCGDQCILWFADCHCGSSDVFRPYSTDQYCCLTPGGSCTRRPGRPGYGEDGVCSCNEGRTLSMSSPCNNTNTAQQCHNNYYDSQNLGLRSHYRCPHTCVLMVNMCQGVSWCDSDRNVCDQDLRCPRDDNYGEFYTKHSLASPLASSDHYFCLSNQATDDGQFHAIDRSDELKVQTNLPNVELNISSFSPCTTDAYGEGPYEPGAWCGKECRHSYYWCVEDFPAKCDTGGEIVSSTDTRLCSNPHVWSNVTCSWNNFDGSTNFGLRCKGKNMECVFPWYTYYTGEIWGSYLTQCPDKSDQVFYSSLTCRQHLQIAIDYHSETFCSQNSYLQYEIICTNKSKWLSEQDKALSDPHSCQESCSKPDSDCLACTNQDYFQCPKSGQCVHPDLVCDGHPQCSKGEDEDLQMCHQMYVRKQILEPYASYKCRHKIYPSTMYVYATPRNNITECFDGSDEPNTNGGQSYNILIASSIGILIFYVVLRLLHRKNQNGDQYIEGNTSPSDTDDFAKFKFQLDQIDHDSQDAINLTNIYILNVINTKTVQEQEKACCSIYDLENDFYNKVESKIHLHLHKLDPKVAQNILVSKFPGLTQRCIKFFEDIARKEFIKSIQNKITKSKRFKETIGLIIGIIKIESKYIDLFKDTALSLLMLEALGGTLIGGTQAIFNLPTAFSSVIVTLLIGSIVVPVFLSTLHLIVNRNLLINKGNFTRLRKYFLIVLCWFCSFFNPVILDAYYHELKEDVRKMTQNKNFDAIRVLRKCRNIRREVVEFHKIELGKL